MRPLKYKSNRFAYCNFVVYSSPPFLLFLVLSWPSSYLSVCQIPIKDNTCFGFFLFQMFCIISANSPEIASKNCACMVDKSGLIFFLWTNVVIITTLLSMQLWKQNVDSKQSVLSSHRSWDPKQYISLNGTKGTKIYNKSIFLPFLWKTYFPPPFAKQTACTSTVKLNKQCGINCQEDMAYKGQHTIINKSSSETRWSCFQTWCKRIFVHVLVRPLNRFALLPRNDHIHNVS